VSEGEVTIKHGPLENLGMPAMNIFSSHTASW